MSFSPRQLMNDIFGGTFTSLKSKYEPGKFEASEYERREQHLENVLNFMLVSSLLRTTIATSITVYRSVDLPLQVGSVYLEPLPFSCSWSLQFCRQWNPSNVILQIEIPISSASFVIASYPDDSSGFLIRAPELNPEQKEVVVAPAQMRIVSTSNPQGCPVFRAIPTFLTVDQIEEIYENPANYSTIRFPIVSPITTPEELAPALSDYFVKLVFYYRRKRPDDDGYTSAQNLLSVLTTGIEETIRDAQPFGNALCTGVHPEISDDLLSRLDGMLYLFPNESVSSAFETLVYIAEHHGCSRSIIFPGEDPGYSARLNIRDPEHQREDQEYTIVLPMLARSTPNTIYRYPLAVPYSALSLNYNLTQNTIDDPEWVVLPITITIEQNYYRGTLRDPYAKFTLKYRGL